MRILIILLVTSNFAFAQYWGGQEVKESDLTPWIPKSEIEYAGTYHFGESEGESDFQFFFAGNYIVGQVHTGYWVENTNIWKSKHINLTNIKIDKAGNLTSDQHQGKFVIYKSESGTYSKALRIDNPWSSWIDSSVFEIGTKTKIVFKDIYYGKYIEASFKKLDPIKLKKMTKAELGIMRNEIYARYGYQFVENGKMDQYFSKQNWYIPYHKDVTSFLSQIELYNIDLIKHLE